MFVCVCGVCVCVCVCGVCVCVCVCCVCVCVCVGGVVCVCVCVCVLNTGSAVLHIQGLRDSVYHDFLRCSPPISVGVLLGDTHQRFVCVCLSVCVINSTHFH